MSINISNLDSLKAVATIGVNAGYSVDKNSTAADMVAVGSAIQRMAEKVETDTGIYVGVVVSDAKVTYKTGWGCPVGGEAIVHLEADANPSYTDLGDAEFFALWRESFLKMVELLMEEFDQTTVTVSWSDGTASYLVREK